MSAATAPLTHLPRTAYPLPLREQAFTLHCQGLRSPAIADALGVPERTIRSWIAAALQDSKEDQQFSRREQLALAVERQRALTVAAWQQFERESAVRDALLDAALAATDPTADTTTTPASSARPAPPHLRLPATTAAPRYLGLILQANKEIARLLGLYTLARLELLSPSAPAPDPTAPAPDPTAPAPAPSDDGILSPAETATTSTATDSANPAIAAKTATASLGLAADIQPADLPPSAPSSVADNPHQPPTTSASATCPHRASSPCLSVPFVSSVVKSRTPAKTATALSPLSAHGEAPAETQLAIREGGTGPGVRTLRSGGSGARTLHEEGPGVKSPRPWMM